MKNSVLKNYQDKVKKAESRIISQEDFRKQDTMVEYIFSKSRWLFTTDLDVMGEDELVRVGGKLTGILAYLGNTTARTRAERDIAENKRDVVLSELTVEMYSDADNKITFAKAQAKIQTAPLDDFVTEKEYNKNNYEYLTEACRTMILFIQSAIKIKLSERMVSKQMYDNGN